MVQLLTSAEKNAFVEICGLIVGVDCTTRRNYIKVNDGTGTVTCIYQRGAEANREFRKTFSSGQMVLVRGKVEMFDEKLHLLVQTIGISTLK